MTPTPFLIPDIVLIIVSYLPSRADVAALSRCSRTLRDITIPELYRKIDTTIVKVDRIAEILRENPALADYCRGLSISLYSPWQGQPPSYEVWDDDRYWDSDYTYSSDSSSSDSDADFRDGLESEAEYLRSGSRTSAPESKEYDLERELRVQLLCDLEYVVHQCSAPGGLLHFSLDLDTDSSLDRSGVLDGATLDWRGLALSKQSLRSLHYSWRYPTSINGLATLSGHSFLAVSDLSLVVEIRAPQEQALRDLLTSFPNVKKLSLTVFGNVDDFASQHPSIDGLHDVTFHQLRSLRLGIDGVIWTQDFVSRQDSLLELHYSGQKCKLVTPAQLKGLSVQSSTGPLQAQLADSINSITILEICHDHSWTRQSSRQWATMLGEFPRLRCLVNSFEYSPKWDAVIEATLDFPSDIRKKLVEFGTVFKFDCFFSPRDIYMYSEILTDILSFCSQMTSLRAFRLSHDNYDQFGEPVELPDELVLDTTKVAEALVYILWEVPCSKRLYKVERGSDGTVKMVYMGRESLTGRLTSPDLTWTNDSVFDHIGLSGGADM